MSRTLGLVTSAELPDGVPEDRLLVDALRGVGVNARFTVWSDPSEEWRRFDTLIIRSPWDYFSRAAEFRDWLSRVEAAGIPLWNPPELLRWNMHKGYLKELAAKGVQTVPARWVDEGTTEDLGRLMDEAGWAEVVVKPAVAAGAYRTHRIRRDDADRSSALTEATQDSDVLVQPFIPEIVADGEWSLVFFDGTFSHALLKRPATGDYRVQPQYGGETTHQTGSEAPVDVAASILGCLDRPPLYARVDGVQTPQGFLLMELELFEPRLFFELAPDAADRLAGAIRGRVGASSPSEKQKLTQKLL